MLQLNRCINKAAGLTCRNGLPGVLVLRLAPCPPCQAPSICCDRARVCLRRLRRIMREPCRQSSVLLLRVYGSDFLLTVYRRAVAPGLSMPHNSPDMWLFTMGVGYGSSGKASKNS